jgi:hypothetical protein
MTIKVNDEWHSVKSIEYYSSNKNEFIRNVAPKEVEDIYIDDEIGLSYKDLEKMHVDYDCPESDVQESMNDYDAAIAPLAERISKLEELMRQIILALDIYKNDKDVLASRDMECLQERVNAFEQCYQVADASKIDWEQRRYEIVKELYARHVYDIGNTAIQAIDAADKLIKQLKKQSK